MKLAILCQPKQDHFLGPLEGALRTRGVEVERTLVHYDQDIAEAFAWADVVWCEWATGIAEAVSKAQPDCGGTPVVVRLHSFEAFTPWPRKIAWENVARCVFVADHVRDVALKEAPQLSATEHVVIHNGVDLDRFQLQEPTGQKRIGVVANVTGKKGPELWLQVLAALPEEFSLHVAGRMDDRRYAYYLPHMAEMLGVADRFHLDGHQADIVEWWRDKDFVLSTSPWEGCPMNLLEAMALGKTAIVHPYIGAHSIVGSHYGGYGWVGPGDENGTVVMFGNNHDEDALRQYAKVNRERLAERGFSLARQADAVAEMLGGLA